PPRASTRRERGARSSRVRGPACVGAVQEMRSSLRVPSWQRPLDSSLQKESLTGLSRRRSTSEIPCLWTDLEWRSDRPLGGGGERTKLRLRGAWRQPDVGVSTPGSPAKSNNFGGPATQPPSAQV